jgi:2-polyprenyl-3-methyl-5-hydroxy-6-metoxy-1,4-benzoquinol methylase
MIYNASYIGLRKDLLKHVQKKSNFVLDIGCATGTTGKYLLDNNISEVVYGVEFSKEMADDAQKIYKNVFCGDLNDKNFRKKIIQEMPLFDCIIFGDILEHLYNPIEVLNDFKSILNKRGRIIISLPNIRHIELFIQVYINGTFPQNKRGIFDETHLRWFTKKDCHNMLKSCNLKLIVYDRNLRARDEIGSKFNWKYNIIKFISQDLVTFQHILVCEHE